MRRFLILLVATTFILGACDSGDGGETSTPDTVTVLDTNDTPDPDAVEPAADVVATPDVTVPEGMDLLSDLEIGWYIDYFPGALFKESYEVPEEMLNDQDYLSGANTAFDAIYDEEEYLLGFARRIFSPVACVLEECYPVEFVVMYDDAHEYLHVRSKGYGVENRDFMKNTVRGGHVPFTDADRELLRTLVADPPEALVDVDDYHDLCEVETEEGIPVSAATLPAYQDYTVTGAVFTVWLVINYRLETDEIILSEAP